MIYAILASLLMTANASVDRSHFGFGANRMKLNNKFNNNINKNENHLLTTNKVNTGVTTSCLNVEQYWFNEAVVDNFGAVETAVNWSQRYWLNKQFYSGPGSPIFVFIGGEGQESCGRLTNRMYLFELAKQHNALLVDVEHRYYGESYPTDNMSTENLSKYLNSQQALADLSRIITYIKKQLNSETSKVITVGGSYPGNLAAWFRLKYPTITHASIASSAPLNAQTNFPEYMDVVGQSLIYFGGQSCYNAVETAANEIANMYNQGIGSDGWNQLNTDFKTCSPMKSTKDLQILLSDLMGNFQGTIQYNNEHNGVLNATDICGFMLDSNHSAYENFVNVAAKYREQSDLECEDASWDDMLTWLTPIKKDPTNAGRPWTFQTCNEFGYFQTTDSTNQPFHSWKTLDLNFYMEMCSAGFDGWKSYPQVDFMNQVYGSRNIDATNIAFSAGTIDPWHALGVTNYTSSLPQSTEYPVYILGTAHCNDLYAPANSDPTSLVNAREVIADHISKWLQ